MSRKKTLLERYNQLGLWSRIGLFGSLASIIGLVIAGISVLLPNQKQTVKMDKSQVSGIYQAGRDVTVNRYELVVEPSEKRSNTNSPVQVLSYKIVDANKGFMRIKVEIRNSIYR